MNERPTLLFSDLDGTLFDANINALKAPFYNLQTSQILTKENIFFVLTTGRPFWDNLSQWLLILIGITKKPDIVITGAGTMIYRRGQDGKLIVDTAWEEKIKKGWDKEEIIRDLKLTPYPTQNPYMIRIALFEQQTETVWRKIKALQDELGKRGKVLVAERRMLENTADIFSGYIIIVPVSAGKDLSSQYVIDTFVHENKNAPDCLFFGDGLIDCDMLSMPKSKHVASSFSYGLMPTPLAREKLKTVPTLTFDSPPKSILNILKGPRNNPLRYLLLPFENVVNKFHPGLTPDNLSFLGLLRMQEAFDKKKKWRIVRYFDAMLLDVLDGIRARHNPELQTPKGQLVDVYCDRMKEFLQLEVRAEKRIGEKPAQGMQTYLALISGILPSIARAKAECLGVIVPEKDRYGGSASHRARLLFFSFISDLFHLPTLSFYIDKDIYRCNMNTFAYRTQMAASFSWTNDSYKKKPMERLLMLIDILQNEYKKNKQFYSKLRGDVNELLNISTGKVRKRYKLKITYFDTV